MKISHRLFKWNLGAINQISFFDQFYAVKWKTGKK